MNFLFPYNKFEIILYLLYRKKKTAAMEKVTKLFDRLPLFAKSRRLKHQNPTGIAGKEKGRRWIAVSQG